MVESVLNIVMNSSISAHVFGRLMLGTLLTFWCSIFVTAVHGGQQVLAPNHPFYVDKDYPKLTTPQWVDEEGVEAVVILAIDDLHTTQKYEQYLRPILNRLKRIDGRAPVSIYCNSLYWFFMGCSLAIISKKEYRKRKSRKT